MHRVRLHRRLAIVILLLFAWSSAGAAALRVHAGRAATDSASTTGAQASGMAGNSQDGYWRADAHKSAAPTVMSLWRAAAFHAGLATARVADSAPALIEICRRRASAARPHAPPSNLKNPLRI
jgi:alkaline phosphatase